MQRLQDIPPLCGGEVHRQVIGRTLVLNDIYSPEYCPDRIVDYNAPLLFDDNHVYSEWFAVQRMLKDKVQVLPVRIQGQPHPIAEGGVPAYVWSVRFVLLALNGWSLLLSEVYM
jgi:hypothetical protein